MRILDRDCHGSGSGGHLEFALGWPDIQNLESMRDLLVEIKEDGVDGKLVRK